MKLRGNNILLHNAVHAYAICYKHNIVSTKNCICIAFIVPVDRFCCMCHEYPSFKGSLKKTKEQNKRSKISKMQSILFICRPLVCRYKLRFPTTCTHNLIEDYTFRLTISVYCIHCKICRP